MRRRTALVAGTTGRRTVRAWGGVGLLLLAVFGAAGWQLAAQRRELRRVEEVSRATELARRPAERRARDLAQAAAENARAAATMVDDLNAPALPTP